MHIPDGYLGPQTYLAAYGVMAPVWAWASSRVRRTLRVRQVPLMAIGAAFTFVIMMFNVPIPGGTSGHAVGAVLAAILLGPWAALVAVSVALGIQALVFGDGGITALGANCFTMGLVMPFAGWWTYRLLAGGSPVTSARRWFSAAVGGYVGLGAASFATAVLLGIQPSLAHDAMGRALYCPFGLGVAVPVMMAEHLLLFGPVEAAVTGLVVAYLGRAEPELLAPATPAAGKTGAAVRWRRLALGLGALVLLTPLGLYLPAKLGAGEAWGEWGAERLGEIAGFVPAGLGRLETLWGAPLPDYAPPGAGEGPLPVLSLWYIVSAALGVLLAGGLLLALRRAIARREDDGHSP